MRSKHFLTVLFLILAIFLSGCGVITDEVKIRNVIDDYFLAINNQDWEKAKNFCMYESEVYYETCSLENYIDSFYPSVVIIIFLIDVFDILITGNYASAYIYGSLTIIIDDQIITEDSPGKFYLQKISNNWKIFDW
jgi:hypothetical protein